jgi:MraZ protein
MLRGNYPATVDAKGRLKIPAAHMEKLRETGSEFYVTSDTGERVLIYPMKVWEELEKKLAGVSAQHPAKQKFLARLSYYGQVVVADRQGRVLIPPVLREAAEMRGVVDVLGALDHVEVWNHQRFADQLKRNELTDEDKKALADLGL